MPENVISNELEYLSKDLIYQQGTEHMPTTLEFHPGETPHTQFGSETLNANVPWKDIVQEIIQRHYTQEQIVKEVEIQPANLINLLNEDYSRLSFRTGARLLSLHYKLYPELEDCHG